MITRRDFIAGTSSLTLLGSPLFNARAAKLDKRNLVIIMLRGGMDGLTAVPVRDGLLDKARPDIQVEGLLSLSSDFSLHPKLKYFHKLWQQQRASIVHATNIPYQLRSHFDGQDLMESGGHVPYKERTGWLGRGIKAAELQGLALSLPMPLLLRGSESPDNYYPTGLKMPPPDLLDKIAQSYDGDEEIAAVMRSVQMRPRSMMINRGRDPKQLARQAAIQLAKADGPRIAVFDIGGFDTHAAQGGADGQHGEKLQDFDRVLRSLSDGLGEALDKTIILTLTEFGRKIEQNGGYGTEHGYGTAILMAGGLVKKPQIYSDWPGLKKKDLFEGQDLMATIDARSVYCSAMASCFQVDFDYLRRQAFFGDPLTDLTDQLFKA